MVSGSLAPVLFELKLGSRTIQAWEYLQVLEMQLVADGAWTARLEMYDKSTGDLEDILFRQGRLASVEMRFGFDEGRGLSHLPVFRGRAATYTPRFTMSGTFVTIDIISTPMFESALNRTDRGFPEGSKYSDVVRAVAEAAGWSTTDYTGRDTIEETAGVSETTMSAVGESDFNFIKSHCIKDAVGVYGTKDFKAFFDGDGVFHYHSPDFLKPAVKHLVFNRAPNGELIRFEVTDGSAIAAVFGGANSRTTGAESSAGEAVEKTATAAGGPQGNKVERLSGQDQYADFGSGLQASPLLHPARTGPVLDRMSQVRWEQSRNQTIAANAIRVGSHDVKVLDYLSVDIYSPAGLLHYLSGAYRVLGIDHKVDGSGWETSYSLSRPGLGSDAPAVAPTVTTTTRTLVELDRPPVQKKEVVIPTGNLRGLTRF